MASTFSVNFTINSSKKFFWGPHHMGCKILAPQPGINPLPLQWKHRVFYQGSPYNSFLNCCLLLSTSVTQLQFLESHQLPPHLKELFTTLIPCEIIVYHSLFQEILPSFHVWGSVRLLVLLSASSFLTLRSLAFPLCSPLSPVLL